MHLLQEDYLPCSPLLLLVFDFIFTVTFILCMKEILKNSSSEIQQTLYNTRILNANIANFV